jgi:sulfopyruvate decarboxylase subunit beta
MGSTIPLALGLALGRSGFSFVCLEGDGSLLMNLGALVTLKRYSSLTASLLKVVILDNRVYETTGGQRCQPDDFAIERVVAGVGLSCAVATEASDIEMFLCDPGKTLLVAKVDEVGEHAPRINEPPKSISERFRRKLCDLGPPKHD